MPLILPSLETQIESIAKSAFKSAMIKFKEESTKVKDNTGKDVFSKANDAASIEFAKGMKKIASEIDKYIKSATITVPPGAAIAGAGGGPAPVVGTVTTPTIATIA